MRSLWNIVVHDVGVDFANVWIGTLHPNLRKPACLMVRVSNTKGKLIREISIDKSQWRRPFRHLKQRFYTLLKIENLAPGSHYQLRFFEVNNDQIIPLPMTDAEFDTIGYSLNDYPAGLNIAIGSCFSEQYDGGAVSHSYQALYNKQLPEISPHFTFLLGDQVYLDVGMDSLSVKSREIRQRIASDYEQHWFALRGIFQHGATWFLADDHEFWNNYPFYSGLNPYLQTLRLESVRNVWRQTARDGVNNIQNVKPVRFINVGEDLSFCLADFRTKRTAKKLLQPEYFDVILDWIAQLKSPGVLVISQPVFDSVGDEDMKLPNYKQYKKLLKAFQHADHDVLVLAGDLHMGRIASFQFNKPGTKDEPGRTLHEVVASPLSNLSGPTSLAARTTCEKSRPQVFPPEAIEGITTNPVCYPERWCVSTEFRMSDLRYLKDRTKEHFSTLNFQKVDNKLEVSVRAWCVRDYLASEGLPRCDFPEPVKFVLT